jgi:hypothetical protein
VLSQQLLKNIWEEVSYCFNCSWLEVLEFRENHVGTPENAAKGLVYHFRQRQYQEQQQQQQQQQQLAAYHQGTTVDTYGTTARFHQPTAACMYSQIQPLHPLPHMGYFNYPPFPTGPPHAYTLPPQPRYASMISPQQAVPPTVTYPVPTTVHPAYHHISGLHHSVLKSQDLYPANGHHTHHHYPTPMTVAPVPLQNGYSVPTQLSSAPALVQNLNCPVPTGQLIELDVAAAPQSSNSDTQQTYSATESASSVLIPQTVCHHGSTHHQKSATLRKTSERQQDSYRQEVQQPQPCNYNTSLQKVQSQPLTSGKAKEDGSGTFESWDYVFRNLESQGYSKDLGERPDILSPSPERMTGDSISHRNHLEDVRNSHQHQQEQSAIKDLEETLMELRLEEFHKALPIEHRPLKINEALQKIRIETDNELCRVPLGKRSPSIEGVDGSVSVYDNMSSPSKDNPERERPVTIATTSSKSNTNISAMNNKASIRTLPRDTRKYTDEIEKSSSLAGMNYLSTTLDPKHLQDSSNHYRLMSNNVDSSPSERNIILQDSTSKVRTDERQGSSENTSVGFSHKSSEVTDKDKWECVTCTFLNVPSCDICEMCGKSKVRGPEIRPLASGGRECPQCTLVNEKGVGTCEACGTSLKDSPTYI